MTSVRSESHTAHRVSHVLAATLAGFAPLVHARANAASSSAPVEAQAPGRDAAPTESVRVRVVFGEADTPVADAVVDDTPGAHSLEEVARLERLGRAVHTRSEPTGVDGTTRLDLAPGFGFLQVEHGFWFGSAQRSSDANDETIVVRLERDRYWTVSAVVRTREGEPMPGVSVQIDAGLDDSETMRNSRLLRVATTDACGVARFVHVPHTFGNQIVRRYRMRAVWPLAVIPSVEFAADRRPADDVVFALPPLGTVYVPLPRSAPSARVRVALGSDLPETEWVDGLATGPVARVEHVEIGRAVHYQLSDTSWSIDGRDEPLSLDERVRVLPSLHENYVVRMTGRLVHDDGRALSSMPLVVRSHAHRAPDATDAQGRFDLEFLDISPTLGRPRQRNWPMRFPPLVEVPGGNVFDLNRGRVVDLPNMAPRGRTELGDVGLVRLAKELEKRHDPRDDTDVALRMRMRLCADGSGGYGELTPVLEEVARRANPEWAAFVLALREDRDSWGWRSHWDSYGRDTETPEEWLFLRRLRGGTNPLVISATTQATETRIDEPVTVVAHLDVTADDDARAMRDGLLREFADESHWLVLWTDANGQFVEDASDDADVRPVTSPVVAVAKDGSLTITTSSCVPAVGTGGRDVTFRLAAVSRRLGKLWPDVDCGVATSPPVRVHVVD